MMDLLRPRLIHICVALLLFAALSPTPSPRSLLSTTSAARTSLASDYPAAGLTYLKDAILLAPQDEQLLFLAAQAALDSGSPDESLVYLDRLDPNSANPQARLCLRAQALATLMDLEKLAALSAENALTCERVSAMLKQFAATFLEERSFDAAEDVLQTLTDIDPADPDLHFQLGALVATHSPKEALPHFRSALERSPQGHPWAEEFIQTIEDASETDSAAYTFAQVGQVFITVQMWEHAVLAFEEAVELQPEYVDALAFLGIALDHIGKDGLAELHRAAGLDPTHPIPHLYLGIHWSKRGELHRALAELERAARLDPQNPTVAIQIGEVYRKLGEQATAIDAYRIATEIAPGEAQYWLLLAQVSLMEEFQVNEIALPAARNALILEPDNPAAVDALGYGYFLLGDLKFAERFLLRAVQLDPSRVQSQYHLGLLMAALERSEPARAAFQMAISLDPDGNVGELARRAMENILK